MQQRGHRQKEGFPLFGRGLCLWLYLGKSRLDGVPVHVQLYTAALYPGQDAEVSFFSLCMDVILHMHSIAGTLNF